jgi:hypothetical protein
MFSPKAKLAFALSRLSWLDLDCVLVGHGCFNAMGTVRHREQHGWPGIRASQLAWTQ